jgi:uroporphyrinogen-III synthase
MNRRIVITRPREDATRLAAQLAEQDIEAVIEPMLEVVPRPLDTPLDLDGAQAILVTSANGVRALARAGTRRDLPLFAVGPASAETAAACGFAEIEAASGDVAALAKLVRARLQPDGGPLIHAAGSHIAGDLAGALEAAGFTVRREVLYEARAAGALSAPLCASLTARELDAVLFFSPRSADTFVTLLTAAGLAQSAASLDALCLSDAVANAAGGVAWRRVAVAERLDQEAVLALLDPGSARVPTGDRGSRT